jgi:hypothetical protein
MNYYVLPNLNTPTATLLVNHPSTLKGKVPKFADKEKFREWCIEDQTKHTFFSTVEGINPHQRVSGGNPPFRIHGFVADYDGDVDTSDMQKLADLVRKKSPGGWSPTWITRTYSGKARAIWEFEVAIPADNETLLNKFIDTIMVETRAKSLLAGFDNASKNPAMYWELGTDWTQVSIDPIAEPKLEMIFFDLAKKTGGPRGKVTIPMDVVAARVEELFPGRWSGEFDVGARGPLFWIDDEIDRVGCIVQAGGIWCYSTRAGKSFIPWAEILGEDFVKAYREKKLAEAVEDTWFDGQKYWVKDGREVWSPILKEDFIMRLRLAGFSHKARKQNDPASEIDEVLTYVQDERRIHGAAPFIFNFEEIVNLGPKRYINTHAHVRVLAPSGDGDPERWPNIFDWWNAWLDDPQSIHFVLSWMQRFYISALEGRVQSGHSLIIAGEHDYGKSLFSTMIMPTIFCGGADAGPFLMGKETFNRELAESAVWYVDDNTSAATGAEHRRFSEMIKKLTATPKITVRAMYREPVDIERRGRVLMTTNTDADSLSILPNLDGTILDKLMIVKMNRAHTPWFRKKTHREIEDTIYSELPHALEWLANQYTPPDFVVRGASGRFGINTFHHPDIISMAKDLSAEQREWEMIQFWWKLRGDETPWEGNVSELMGNMETFDELKVFTRTLNKIVFGRTMSKLASQYPDQMEKRLVSGTVTYKIGIQ